MTRSRLFKQVAGDAVLYGFSAASAKALALLTVPFLTRALTPDGYGIADLATSTAALLTLVMMFAGDIPAARAHALAGDDQARSRTLASFVWMAGGLSICLALLLMPAAQLIAGALWGSDGLGLLAAMTLLLVPVSSLQAASAQTLRIQGRPRAFAAVSLVDLLAQLALAVAFVAAGMGPAGVVLGFIVGSIVGLVAAAVAARETLRARPDWTVGWGLLKEGVRFLPHVTMFVIADWAIRSLLATQFGPERVAELGLAIRVASVLSLVGAAFALAWGPIGLARARDQATQKLFGRVLTAYGVTAVATAIGLGAIGPDLVPIVAGPGYEGAAPMLLGFAFAYAIAGAEYVLVVAAGVSGRGSRVALAATVGATAQVATAAFLIPILGPAAIGPIVVLGRGISFGILLTSVQSIVQFSIPRLVASGAVVLLAFATIQLLLVQDKDWPFVRWLIALALSLFVAMSIGRLIRSDPKAKVDRCGS